MQRNKVVLGLQWGDEGKGKIIDVLAGRFDLVVRCQGGANAGHTVVVDGRKTVLHLLPSGALHQGVHCIVGNGVVVDPQAMIHELADLGDVGRALEAEGRLTVSDRAHLVLPCHKLADRASEKRRGESKVGTTLRGIGPCYTDKVSRLGLRCGDLKDMTTFAVRARQLLEWHDRNLRAHGDEGFDVAVVLAEILPACSRIAPMVGDTTALLHQAMAQQKAVLFEGAQGQMLDIDFGTYPYVTSSNTGIGGVITGSGLPHKAMGEVIGIVKAYTTRVGAGPFPVELTNAIGDGLRTRGGEYGATTGRPRRCGWLDLVVVEYACRLNGVDTIALTKLDVLSGMDRLPVCIRYRLDGRETDTVPARIEDLERVEPIYREMAGWKENLAACRNFNELPVAARDYVRMIEERTRIRVGYIGVGPGRDEIIVR